ncbi:MAG TPA: hypothetical protein VHF25_02185 [Nitriliruptorales bacterium]|nr:hypothetical protein [Nitriliruptorales bacterium]
MESNGRTVVADFEAGIGTLTRMQPGDVDAVLVIVEPTPKSIEVASRAADLARERSLGRILVVANRVRDAADVDRIRAALPGHHVVAVPDDPAVLQAEREGVAPLDQSPRAPAVQALVDLAESLVKVGAA